MVPDPLAIVDEVPRNRFVLSGATWLQLGSSERVFGAGTSCDGCRCCIRTIERLYELEIRKSDWRELQQPLLPDFRSC